MSDYGTGLYGAGTYGDFSGAPSPGLYPTPPTLSCRLSFDDVSVTTPTWVEVEADVRSFSTSRGRDSELSDISAGTATVVFDNRNNFYEPSSTGARPMNRVWLQETYLGITETIFYGYVDSYTYDWPEPGFSDALATASCTDEFKVLALGKLPQLSPADKTSYTEVVQSDSPHGYWRLADLSNFRIATATVGENLSFTGFIGSNGNIPGPIAGSDQLATQLYYGATMYIDDVQPGESTDLGGSAQFAVEFWFAKVANPAAQRRIITAPASYLGFPPWYFDLETSGAITCHAFEDTLADHTVSSTALANNTWYHVVVTTFDGWLRIFLNGAQVALTAWPGPLWPGALQAPLTYPNRFLLGTPDTETHAWSELALYRHGLRDDRILAHWMAGSWNRGFVQHRSDVRINAILDVMGSTLARSLDTGIRDTTPTFLHGQAPLDEIKIAVQAENDAAMFFAAAADGPGLVFRDAGYRYLLDVKATFGDETIFGQLPYEDLETDYSESFLYNKVSATREGGQTQTQEDAASISDYFERPLELSGLKVLTDFDANEIASRLLAKHKQPMERVTAILLDISALNAFEFPIASTVFRLELGDRVRVIRTLPGGGWFDQSVYVQKIDISGANDGRPWKMRLGVSPL